MRKETNAIKSLDSRFGVACGTGTTSTTSGHEAAIQSGDGGDNPEEGPSAYWPKVGVEFAIHFEARFQAVEQEVDD